MPAPCQRAAAATAGCDGQLSGAVHHARVPDCDGSCDDVRDPGRRSGQALRRDGGPGRSRSGGPHRHGAGRPRPERGRQDYRRADPGDPAAPRRGASQRRWLRRGDPGAPGPPDDRPDRAVRRGRREPDRGREPAADRAPARPAQAGCPPARARAAGRLRARRRRRPRRQDLLRWHAAPPRPGRQPGRPAQDRLPRRADHRPGPKGQGRPLAGGAEPGQRRRDRAAHHPVHGGGRPARRRHRRDGPWAGRRHRHARPAQGEDRRPGPGGQPVQRGRPRHRRRRGERAVRRRARRGERRGDRHGQRRRAAARHPPAADRRAGAGGGAEPAQAELDEVFFTLTGHRTSADDAGERDEPDWSAA
jgi:hypothetical protein